jgi:YgiT-type zinc finger domain-containing protein
MRCDNCGKQRARIRDVARTYGKGKDFLLIQNIPVIDCPDCGESYMTADTLHEIERIKLHRRSFAVKRPIQVVAFAA